MDRIFRFIYVALIPMFLAVLDAVFPVRAIVITAALATAIAVMGPDRWRQRTARIPVLGKPLGKFARLGDYYAEHRPKPLLYYLLYPLLFPYWLIHRAARAEFLLYRRLSAFAALALVGVGAHEYLAHWYPDLPFRMFVTEGVVLTLFQLLFTFVVVMPIVTTVVIFHRAKHREALHALLAIAALTTTYGFIHVHFKHPVPAATAMRVRVRTRLAERTVQACLDDARPAATCRAADPWRLAMTAALAAAAAHPNDAEDAEDAARDALTVFYRADEADTFRLLDDGGVLVLYARPDARGAPIWLARDQHDATAWQDPAKLPARVRTALHL